MKLRMCMNCNSEFVVTRKNKKYCSVSCGEEYRLKCCVCASCNTKIKLGRKYCDECFKIQRTEYNNFKKEDVKEKIRATKFDKYGNANYNNSEKTKKTCLEKYGATSVFASEYGKQKIIETNLQRYGVEDSRSSNETIEKRKETIANGSKTGWFNSDEWNAAMIAKYGTTIPARIPEVKQKIKETNMSKYGVDHPLKNDKIKSKVIDTNLSKYGVECSLANKQIREKAISTMIERYGVDNASKSALISSRKRKKIEYDGIYFASSPEVEVYKFCRENELNVKYEPITIRYFDSLNKEHYYTPDFEINGQLYEVKGDHLLDENDRLRFPYFNGLSNEELSDIEKWYEAKTECMLKNNVKILRTSKLNEELNNMLVKQK